ncbi:MAG: inner membrane-spanning protein YciB [Gammaproteobacteria bacterium]
MRNLINFAPAAVFFGAYYFSGDFQTATAALMAAVAGQIALLKILKLRVGAAEWAVAGLVLVFGGATLLLRETAYLQIKTTAVNWLFAAALLGADLIWKKNLARALLGGFFTAEDWLWRRVSGALAAMFFLLGAVNLAVIRNVSEENWVWIKTFAYPAASFVFLLGVVFYLARNASLKNE